jgi:hypothetical protein
MLAPCYRPFPAGRSHPLVGRSPLPCSSVEIVSAAEPPDCFRIEKPAPYSCSNLQQCVYGKYRRSSLPALSISAGISARYGRDSTGRLETLKSFDEFLERRLPESRRKAYYLMSIHEHLPPEVKRDLKEIGWTKGRELNKLARVEGQHFDCAPWVHTARLFVSHRLFREQHEATNL